MEPQNISDSAIANSTTLMSLITRKPVFGVSDQERLKPDAQADLRLSCSHMAKTGFLMARLISDVIRVSKEGVGKVTTKSLLMNEK